MKPKVTYWNDGINDLFKIEYFNDKDELHNENGPAITEFFVKNHKNTHRSREFFYIKGKLHNLNGPAVNIWFLNEDEPKEEYWINGEFLTKDQWEQKCQKGQT